MIIGKWTRSAPVKGSRSWREDVAPVFARKTEVSRSITSAYTLASSARSFAQSWVWP